MSSVRLTGADNTNKLTTINTTTQYTIIAKLVEDCYEEEDIDKKVQILYKINSLLPKTCCINIPSLITDDYIDTALYRIEENIHSIIASPYP
ncbi:MAG: hypothetical protein ACJ71O_02280 [Nitrososphaeraceae archaeon]|jgi:hypothetical protein